MRPVPPVVALLVLALLGVLGASPARAQPLPVDVLFCNIDCTGADPQASCRIALVDGLVLAGKRIDIFALQTGDGVEVGGEISIPTGDGGSIALAQAALELRFSEPGPNACESGFDVVRGEALLPVPGAGALRDSAIEVVQQPMASIGLDLGENLIPSASPWCLPEFGIDCACAEFCLDDVPILRGDAHYLFFDVDSRYVFSIAGFELPSSPGVSASFVLDPSDPYFFLTGSAMGIPGLKTPLNASSGGFGFSWNDEIPFVPLSTYPFGDVMEPFQGGYAARLALPIFETEFERVKVLLDGMLIASLDPDQDGDHPFLTPEGFLADPDLALGANGAFSVRFSPFKKQATKAKPAKPGKPAKPTTDKDVQKEGKKAQKSGLGNSLLAVTFEAGAASAVGRVHPSFAELYLSGTVGDGESLLPDYMPLPLKAGAGTKLAAYFTTKPAGSFVQAEGALGLDTTTLARWAKMEEIGVVLGVDGFLRVDDGGFFVAGSSGSQMHPSVSPSGMAGVEARIAPNGVDSFVTLRGAMTVAGEGFPDAALTLSPRGMEISGTMRLDAHELDMRGSFRGTSGHLEGGTRVEIPYEREDTVKKLQLLDQILNQSEEVELAESLLGLAERDLQTHRQNAEAVVADLGVAIAQVEALQDQIDAFTVQIAQKESDLADQVARNCNADFTGCPSCSSCSSCASRCSCGTLDFECHADCVACETVRTACLAARTACLATRETCRLANIVICEGDRAVKVAAIAVEIAALETARAGVTAAKDVALGVLEPIQAAAGLALAALATAEETAEAAQAGLDAAQAGLGLLQDQLENLPPISGDVVADLSIAIDTGPKGTRKTGKVVGTFEGRKVAKGRIDLEASPSIVCVTVPLKGFGEICTPL
jgi:hypothetical protein